MKRCVLLLLGFLMLCIPAMAEEIVELPDAVVTYTPPEGFYLLTRESSASVFNRVGLSQRELLPWMEQNDAYAVMYDLERGCELLLYISPSEEDPLEDMSEDEQTELCAYLAESYALDGYEDVTVVIHEGTGGEFVQFAARTWDWDGAPCYIVTLMALRSGYSVQISLFMYGGDASEYVLERVLTMADSLCITVNADVDVLSAKGVSIRVTLPETMAMCDVLPEPPEAPAGEVIGAAASEDGAWFVQWQLFDGATGDMERLSASGLRSLYESRAKQKRSAGFTVTLQESCTELRQVYVHLCYELPSGWYAEEYYTKQGGWGVIVTAYRQGQPMTEAEQEMLRQLVSNQLITVRGD
ncbi:MAG: hypothetical protein IKK57_02285 [Clostridia bacterium]|nr:hypothetical protein [Clostridia bacterium]